ncbi:MAG: HAMP domain-containing histidine kinase [Bacteroidia bacterium]|nr:HAMP domain-containing histidine kinase [Bacteroidia bacterium]
MANDSKKLDSLINLIKHHEDSNTLKQIYTLGKSGWNTKDILLLKRSGSILEEYANTTNNKILKAKAYLCYGMAFSLNHQYEKAFFYLFSSLRMCEQLHLFDVAVSVNNIIAYNYFNTKNYKKSIVYAQNTIKFLDQSQLGRSLYYVDSYRIIGEAYLQLNNLDLGKEYYFKSLDYAIKDKDSQGIQFIYYSISSLFLDKTQIDSAKYYINKALFLTQATTDSSFYQYVYLRLASIFLKEKKYKDCLRFITKAFQTNKRFNDLALKIDIMNLLTLYYKDKKDYYNAFIHSEIANRLVDSLHSIEVDKKVIEIEALFETTKAHAKITELNTLNQINSFKLKSEQREKNALIIVLYISFIAIFVIGFIYIQKNNLANKLKRINHEKTEMMGILSHDLRSPLTKIHALNSILIQDNELKTHQETFNRINEIIKEATVLIQNLLDVSTLETTADNLRIEPVDLIDELLLLKLEYSRIAARKGVEVHLEIDSTELIINTDRLKLKRIFDNLLSNAIKYSPIKGTVTIKVMDYNHQIEFSFIDSGIGLTESEQSVVFNKFARLSVKPTMGESATGLGLFITHKLVNMIKGEIRVISKKFEGSVFSVTLPKSYE